MELLMDTDFNLEAIGVYKVGLLMRRRRDGGRGNLAKSLASCLVIELGSSHFDEYGRNVIGTPSCFKRCWP